jgi:hypothetical protein
MLVKQINELLINHFGTDTITGLPIWRVSWAPEQFEKRFATWVDKTPSGIFIREVTEVREVVKYPHLREHYILERLVGVPEYQQAELADAKISYEPMHPFWNGSMKYLPPNWLVCKFIIDTVYAAMGQSSLRKYVDPDADGNNGLESQKKRVEEIRDGLYGNETAVGDALGYKTGVFLDSTKQKGN